MTKSKKYPNGYIPKIEYWSGKLNYALAMGDQSGVEYANRKLTYFVGKQVKLQKAIA